MFETTKLNYLTTRLARMRKISAGVQEKRCRSAIWGVQASARQPRQESGCTFAQVHNRPIQFNARLARVR